MSEIGKNYIFDQDIKLIATFSAQYEVPIENPDSPKSLKTATKLWQPNLTHYPTSNVMCVNCCKIVRTCTTYSPGPKACCLGSLSFIFG